MNINWRSQAGRSWLYQILAIALVVLVAGWLINNTLVNMKARGIQSGFDFLLQSAGFAIGESPIPYDADNPYWKAFLVGLLNTVRVALVGIILCTVLGTLVGVGRVSSNALARGICYAYTELFRNIPVLLQLMMWYILMVEWMPDPDAPLRLGNWLLFSKMGLQMAFPVWVDHAPFIDLSLPELVDGEYLGGLTLTPEFFALTLGLTLYTAAFVAEVVRGGIQSVSRGQREAAQSLSLSPWQTTRLVILPQAMRVIVPPLTNQYLNLTKNSSLAVAIGYPDLVNIATTSLNQTGRAVECIAVIMTVYLFLSLLTSFVMNAYNRKVAIKER
ncbi:MAG: hypothetical protein RL111_2260 [Pseudomonadota bacterium]